MKAAKRDGKLVEFQKRDKPAARSGNATPAYDDEDYVNEDDPTLITQRNLITYNILKLKRQRIQTAERKMRDRILSKFAAGVRIEDGPHFIGKTERVTIR